jgi:hypothetical protein
MYVIYRNKCVVTKEAYNDGQWMSVAKKPLYGAVAARALAGNIAHGDGVGCTKCSGNDGAQLAEHVAEWT